MTRYTLQKFQTNRFQIFQMLQVDASISKAKKKTERERNRMIYAKINEES